MIRKDINKRIIAVALALFTVLAFVGCGGDSAGDQGGDKAKAQTEQQTEQQAPEGSTGEADAQPPEDVADAEPLATLFFASDYQSQTGFDAPAETLAGVIGAAEKDGKKIDEIVICGDYTNDRRLHDYQLSPEEHIGEIRDVIKAECPELTDKDGILFVQGNHDKLTESIAESGLHEFDNYLVYVVNTQNDFPWKQGKVKGCLKKVTKTSEDMKACFDELIARGEKRPVIIAAHVPLHFSGRTSSLHSTGDNLYSSLLFDVINEAAKSLDIIYLFGHNHTKGWDCYLGMSCVFKSPGTSGGEVGAATDEADASGTILIPEFTERDLTSDTYRVEDLNFVYMNAGYIGHCMNCSPDDVAAGRLERYKAADDTLTGTICEIYGDRIELTRYSTEGVYKLSSAGCASPYYKDSRLIPEQFYSRDIDSPFVMTKKNENL